MVFVYLKKIQSLDFFDHLPIRELTLNPFCQHCFNKILTFDSTTFYSICREACFSFTSIDYCQNNFVPGLVDII